MYFLEHGAQADGKASVAGYTPLHWATSMSETPITYRGIEAPGEWRSIPGVPDPDLRVALVKALLNHGANLEARITKPMMTVVAFEARSRTGGTPFFTAASSGDAPMMRLLLYYGGALFSRPDMADFVGTLGGISIGKVDLESYIDQVRPVVTTPKVPPPPPRQ